MEGVLVCVCGALKRKGLNRGRGEEDGLLRRR